MPTKKQFSRVRVAQFKLFSGGGTPRQNHGYDDGSGLSEHKYPEIPVKSRLNTSQGTVIGALKFQGKKIAVTNPD